MRSKLSSRPELTDASVALNHIILTALDQMQFHVVSRLFIMSAEWSETPNPIAYAGDVFENLHSTMQNFDPDRDRGILLFPEGDGFNNLSDIEKAKIKSDKERLEHFFFRTRDSKLSRAVFYTFRAYYSLLHLDRDRFSVSAKLAVSILSEMGRNSPFEHASGYSLFEGLRRTLLEDFGMDLYGIKACITPKFCPRIVAVRPIGEFHGAQL